MDKIDFNQSKQYHLLLRLQRQSEASFYVYSQESPTDGHYEEIGIAKTSPYVESLKEAVFSNNLLSFNYKNIKIMIVNGLFTLLPAPFATGNTEDKKSFLQFNFEDTQNKKTLVDSVAACGLENIFGLPLDTYNFLQRTFPFAEYVHYISPMLQYFANQKVLGEKGRVYLHVNNTEISVFCFNENRIEVVNTFPCTDTNDAAYFILNLWERMKFDPLKDGLHIAGLPDRKAELITVLSRFIANVVPENDLYYSKDSILLPFDIQSYLAVNAQ
ncbi:MAG: DUF3822 family protein [Bacteroidales bacterium]|jgi:hypothetical protein|nr:DUF3822 family protein [Bacteroidales bacterium]